jgi:hypothetical protein
MEISKLTINKKITAFFADGSTKMNLGIATVVDLLNNKKRVPVDVAPVHRASRLLADLAKSAGRVIEKDDDGMVLVQPGTVEPVSSPEVMVEPVSEVIAEPVADEPVADKPTGAIWPDDTATHSEMPIEPKAEPVVTVAPKAQKVATPKPVKVRKYQTLGTIFFTGSPQGQIVSVFKARETNPQKVADYKAALAAGDCTLGDPSKFPKSITEKLEALGITHHQGE